MSILNFHEWSLDFSSINEWNSFNPENTHNHVYVYGVENGKITEDGSGVMAFDNIENAKETFKELDPSNGSKNFTKAYAPTTFSQQNNFTATRGVMVFSTWKKINTYNNFE